MEEDSSFESAMPLGASRRSGRSRSAGRFRNLAPTGSSPPPLGAASSSRRRESSRRRPSRSARSDSEDSVGAHLRRLQELDPDAVDGLMRALGRNAFSRR